MKKIKVDNYQNPGSLMDTDDDIIPEAKLPKTSNPEEIATLNELAKTIKAFMEPIVYYTIAGLEDRYFHENKNINLVVAGGAATALWMNNTSKYTETKDFDIKLVYPKSYYNNDWKLSTEDNNILMTETELITLEFVKNCNAYIKAHKTNFNELLKDNNIPFVINNEDFFYFHKEWANLLVVRWDVTGYTDDIYESLIDIYPISNNMNKPRGWQLNPYRDDEILSNYNNNLPIPTFEFYKIKHAALGYIILDLINLVNSGIYYEKNFRKLKAILATLNTPNDNLNCAMLDDYVTKCKKDSDKLCTFEGKVLRNEQIIEYGMNKKKFPNDYERLYFIRYQLGEEYLCDYIKRNKKQVFPLF